MTEKRYDLNAYLDTCTATVLSCTEKKDGGYDVVLDKTCFFPESGGQPFDTGTIGDAIVRCVTESNGIIHHLCDMPLEADSFVRCAIDFGRRFQNMQAHTGEHILSGILKSEYGISNIGFHIGSACDYLTIDTDREISGEMAKRAELLANEKIYANIPVKVFYPDSTVLPTLPLRKKPDFAADIRVVSIDGCDVCACCGTHVAFTGEVGIIKITEVTKYKSGSRLRVLCGEQAVLDYQSTSSILTGLCTRFSSQPDNLRSKIDKSLSELSENKQILSQRTKQLMKYIAQELLQNVVPVDGFKKIIYLSPVFSPDDLKVLATAIVDQEKSSVALLFSETDHVYRYILSSGGGQDMRTLSQSLRSRFGGSGGGTAAHCQGSTGHTTESELLSFLNSI